MFIVLFATSTGGIVEAVSGWNMINNKLIASALCFIAFLLFYGLTSRSDVQLTDEVAVFASAISLETQGNLAIDELPWQ